MKKNLTLRSILLACAGVLLLLPSCSKDSNSPAWATKWVLYDTETFNNATYDTRQLLDLHETSFVSSNDVNLDGTWKTFARMEGTLKETSGKFSLHVSKLGMSSFDLNGLPTGQVTMYNSGTSEFNQILDMMGMPEEFDAYYTLSGNSIVLSLDLNLDGDTTDADEGNQTFVKLN